MDTDQLHLTTPCSVTLVRLDPALVAALQDKKTQPPSPSFMSASVLESQGRPSNVRRGTKRRVTEISDKSSSENDEKRNKKKKKIFHRPKKEPKPKQIIIKRPKNQKLETPQSVFGRREKPSKHWAVHGHEAGPQIPLGDESDPDDPYGASPDVCGCFDEDLPDPTIFNPQGPDVPVVGQRTAMTSILCKDFSQEDLTTFLSSCSTKLSTVNSEEVPSDLKSCPLTEFQAMMEKLVLKPQNKVQVVPKKIGSVAFHPRYDGALLATGCVNTGTVSLWNVDLQGKFRDEHLMAFDYHKEGVNCVSFSEYHPHALYTSSYDGTFYCGDLNKQQVTLEYRFPRYSMDKYPRGIGTHVEREPQVFLLGSCTGFVRQVDIREPRFKPKHYSCHYGKYVRSISVHPQQRYIFASSNTHESSVNLWDLRKMTGGYIGLEEPLSKISFKSGVSCVCFSPCTGNQLLSTCSDNFTYIHDCSNLSRPVKQSSVSHINRITIFQAPVKAVWHPQREDVFITGCMKKERSIEIFKTEGDKVELLAQLKHPKLLTTITPVSVFHPNLPMAAVGNSSGVLHLFTETENE